MIIQWINLVINFLCLHSVFRPKHIKLKCWKQLLLPSAPVSSMFLFFPSSPQTYSNFPSCPADVLRLSILSSPECPTHPRTCSPSTCTSFPKQQRYTIQTANSLQTLSCVMLLSASWLLVSACLVWGTTYCLLIGLWLPACALLDFFFLCACLKCLHWFWPLPASSSPTPLYHFV